MQPFKSVRCTNIILHPRSSFGYQRVHVRVPSWAPAHPQQSDCLSSCNSFSVYKSYDCRTDGWTHYNSHVPSIPTTQFVTHRINVDDSPPDSFPDVEPHRRADDGIADMSVCFDCVTRCVLVLKSSIIIPFTVGRANRRWPRACE